MLPNDVREALEYMIGAGIEGGLDADDPELIAVRTWLEKPYSHRNGETTAPEVEGWYWFRYTLPVHVTEIVRVHRIGMARMGIWHQSRELYAHFSGSDTDELVGELSGYWHGPIPEPEE